MYSTKQKLTFHWQAMGSELLFREMYRRTLYQKITWCGVVIYHSHVLMLILFKSNRSYFTWWVWHREFSRPGDMVILALGIFPAWCNCYVKNSSWNIVVNSAAAVLMYLQSEKNVYGSFGALAFDLVQSLCQKYPVTDSCYLYCEVL